MARKQRFRQEMETQRWEIVEELHRWLEGPMVVLGFAWLALLVVELVHGLHPMLERATTVIWVIFVVDFLLRFSIAPRKIDYIQNNWLTVLALAVPALRALRFLRLVRVLRAARGLRLLRIVTSINRGMRALGRSLSRRGFGYAAALTLLVATAGAAGMYAFENLPGERGLNSYAEALWWTMMIMTTMGSEYWPQTPEGRLLCLFLAVFAFAVFGYLTAALASFFVGRDAENAEGEVAGEAALRELQAEIAELRHELRRLLDAQPIGGAQGPPRT